MDLAPSHPRATASLQPDVAGAHEALPAASNTTAVLAQAACAVLPVAARQLELLQHELDQDSVLLCRPLFLFLLSCFSLDTLIRLGILLLLALDLAGCAVRAASVLLVASRSRYPWALQRLEIRAVET